MNNGRLLVDIDDAVIEVEACGRGIPILIPTGAGSAYYRNTFSAALLERLQLIYVHVRGTGASSGQVTRDTTFASLAADLERARERLGIERPAVLGHSNHGAIALEYGIAFPEHTRAIVSHCSRPDFRTSIVEGMARWEREASPEANTALAKSMAAFDSISHEGIPADEVAVRRSVAMSALGWRDHTLDTWPLWGGAPPGAAHYFDWMAMALPLWDRTAALRAFEPPLLAICGRYDYLCPSRPWEEYISTLPHGELVMFEDSAHNPQYEEQSAFDAALLGFLIHSERGR